MTQTSRKNAVQVGMMGLLALVLLLGDPVGEGIPAGSEEDHLHGPLPGGQNLAEGDPVNVRGVRKGRSPT